MTLILCTQWGWLNRNISGPRWDSSGIVPYCHVPLHQPSHILRSLISPGKLSPQHYSSTNIPTPLVFCAVARYCWTVVGPLYRPVSCLPVDCMPLKSQMGQHKKEIVISVSHSSIWMHMRIFLINCVFAKSAGIWNVDFNKCFLRVNNQFLIWNSIHVNIKHMYLRSRAKTLQNRKTSFTLSQYSKIIYIF